MNQPTNQSIYIDSMRLFVFIVSYISLFVISYILSN